MRAHDLTQKSIILPLRLGHAKLDNTSFTENNFGVKTMEKSTCLPCPDARERAGPVFPPPPHSVGEEETHSQAQRARARRDKCLPSCPNNFKMRKMRPRNKKGYPRVARVPTR